MDKDIIAKNLRKFLHENQLTQEDFARMINAPLSSVNSWLHGRRHMSKVWQQMLMDKKVLPQEEAKAEFRFGS